MKSYWAEVCPLMIDKQMARDYARQRNRAPATVRYELSMLSVAMRWAMDKKLIEKAPRVWLPEIPPSQEKHLSKPHFELFYDAVKAPHARLYVLLGLYTMARPSAILELTWDRVDWDRKLLDLNPAGRVQTLKRRPVVALNDEASGALAEAYCARQTNFVIERGGKPIKCIKKAFSAATERSGIKATAYTLRHTGAVWAAESGISMSELAQFMGHRDSSTTERHYARYSPHYLRNVANAVRRQTVA